MSFSALPTEYRDRILQMRVHGYSLEEIAAHLGIPKKDAKGVVREVMEDLMESQSESRDETVALEISRLELLMKSLEERVKKGAYEAINAMLKLMERHAKLRGLDAPTKTASMVFSNMTDEELNLAARRLGLKSDPPLLENKNGPD